MQLRIDHELDGEWSSIFVLHSVPRKDKRCCGSGFGLGWKLKGQVLSPLLEQSFQIGVENWRGLNKVISAITDLLLISPKKLNQTAMLQAVADNIDVLANFLGSFILKMIESYILCKCVIFKGWFI